MDKFEKSSQLCVHASEEEIHKMIESHGLTKNDSVRILMKITKGHCNPSVISGFVESYFASKSKEYK